MKKRSSTATAQRPSPPSTRTSASMPVLDQTASGRPEQEPLLGRPGDATQTEGKPIYHNLVMGEDSIGREPGGQKNDARRRVVLAADARMG